MKRTAHIRTLLAAGRVTTDASTREAIAAIREAQRKERGAKLAALFLVKKGVSVEVDEQPTGVFLHLTTVQSATKIFGLFVRDKATLQAHGDAHFTVFVPGACALTLAWEPALLLDKTEREDAERRGIALPMQPAKAINKAAFTTAIKPA